MPVKSFFVLAGNFFAIPVDVLRQFDRDIHATNDRGDMVVGFDGTSPFARNYSSTSGSWAAPDTWSTSVGPVGQVTTYDIALDAQGNALLAWYNNTTHQVCYERRLVGTNTGTGRCADTDYPGGSGAELILAINESGAGYLGLVVNSMSDGNHRVYLQGIDTRGRIDLPAPSLPDMALRPGFLISVWR